MCALTAAFLLGAMGSSCEHQGSLNPVLKPEEQPGIHPHTVPDEYPHKQPESNQPSSHGAEVLEPSAGPHTMPDEKISEAQIDLTPTPEEELKKHLPGLWWKKCVDVTSHFDSMIQNMFHQYLPGSMRTSIRFEDSTASGNPEFRYEIMVYGTNNCQHVARRYSTTGTYKLDHMYLIFSVDNGNAQISFPNRATVTMIDNHKIGITFDEFEVYNIKPGEFVKEIPR